MCWGQGGLNTFVLLAHLNPLLHFQSVESLWEWGPCIHQYYTDVHFSKHKSNYCSVPFPVLMNGGVRCSFGLIRGQTEQSSRPVNHLRVQKNLVSAPIPSYHSQKGTHILQTYAYCLTVQKYKVEKEKGGKWMESLMGNFYYLYVMD